MSELKDLPTGWEIVSLSVLADINPKLPFEFVQPDIDVSFLPMKLIEEENNQIHLTEYRKYEDVKKGFTPMVDGDVIFAKITPCMENGKIAVVHSLKNGIAFGSTEFHVLRCNTVVFNTFLFYFLVQKNTRQEAQQYMTGAVGQRRVPKSYLESLQIPLPPLAEQHRIVAKIEELFSALDKGVESLKTAREQLKIYRQAVLKWAFEGKLTNNRLNCDSFDLYDKPDGENDVIQNQGNHNNHKNQGSDNLPEGWKWVKLGEITEKIQIGPFGSQLHREDYIQNGIPLINPMHIQGNKIIPDYSYSITEEKKNSLTNYILKEGDVIMGRRGEMGRCGLVQSKENGWFCGTGSLYIRPKATILLSKYLHLLIGSASAKKYLEDNAAGTTMANLNSKIINQIPIPLPPTLPEQHRIVAEIERRLSVCDTIEASIEESLQKADALRQSILKKAFEGKLVPQDPADEPASVLLERVRVERAAAKGEEGGKKRKEY